LQRDYSAYLEHILDCISSIEEYTENLSYAEFLKDKKTIEAVIRNLEVIGEASTKISKSFREKYPDVPWKSMIGLRNILIHEYFGVDKDAVWGNIKKNLPELKKQIQSIIEEEDSQSRNPKI